MGTLESRLAKAEQKAQAGNINWVKYEEGMDLQHLVLRYEDAIGTSWSLGTGLATLPELLNPYPYPYALIEIDELFPLEYALGFNEEQQREWLKKHKKR